MGTTTDLNRLREQVEQNLKEVKDIEKIAKDNFEKLLKIEDKHSTYSYEDIEKMKMEKDKKFGIYIFFDSNDGVRYVGKSETDLLWEIKKSFVDLLPYLCWDSEMQERMAKEKGLEDIDKKIKEFEKLRKKATIKEKENWLKGLSEYEKIVDFAKKELRVRFVSLDSPLQAALLERIFLGKKESLRPPWNKRGG